METITFYSYKGGVGRTLALANIAVYLSRFKQNVCIMDFDLEAPGLHYKFPQLVEPMKIQKGLVDYIYEFTQGRILPQSLSEFSLKLSENAELRGEIRLIPAGNAFSYEYWRKLASIDWHSLFYEKNSEGVPFFLEFKEKVNEEFNPDFLLIDSRTGITEMSGICTYLLPEKVVFLIINNPENIEGARQILRSIQRIERFPGQESIDVTFALARIPFPNNDKEKVEQERILEHVMTLLNEPVEDLKSQLEITSVFMLHSDRDLELSESLRISHQGIAKETVLSRDYLKLFRAIVPLEIIERHIKGVVDQISNKIWDNPEIARKELEELAESNPAPIVFERLITLCMMTQMDKKKIIEKFHKLYQMSDSASAKIFSRYVSLFLEEEDYFRGPRYNLRILQEYLDTNPSEELRYRLARAYMLYGSYENAFIHFSEILEGTKDLQTKETVLENLLDVCIKGDLLKQGKIVLETYGSAIEKTTRESLQIKRIEMLLELHNWQELREIINTNIGFSLPARAPKLYLQIMIGLRREQSGKKTLLELADSAALSRDWEAVLEIGIAFYQSGMRSDFESELARMDIPSDILQTLRKDLIKKIRTKKGNRP